MSAVDRQIIGKKPHFRPVKKGGNFYQIMLLVSMILVGTWVKLSIDRGQIKPAFQPTPTPTRMAGSYILEARAYFDAGKLDDPSNNITPTPLPPNYTPQPTATPEDSEEIPPTPTPIPRVNDAIEAYLEAVRIDPDNAVVWAELARTQVYSSRTLPSDPEALKRLEEAVESARKAVELAPDDSMAHATLAFALDWYATNRLVDEEEAAENLNEAMNESVRAYQLDPNNALALAYYAEVLADQQKWAQAEQYAYQALQHDPNSVDTHRVYGYIQESFGYYKNAIEQYEAAVKIAPNMTFLYIQIGVNWRRIGQDYPSTTNNPYVDLALEYFDKAAKINEMLGVMNPVPYIEIARTYTQVGQFLVAGVNARKALEVDPYNGSTYGQLGSIFIRARNYEGAVPLLKCAVRGCTAEENEMGGVAVQGLPISNKTIGYVFIDYGTVLAFLSRDNMNFCNTMPDGSDGAMAILEEVRRAYPDDPIILGIIDDSQGICRRLAARMAGLPTETPFPTATPEP
jgi:tetratricopeptide (TPR) repeat protein